MRKVLAHAARKIPRSFSPFALTCFKNSQKNAMTAIIISLAATNRRSSHMAIQRPMSFNKNMAAL